MPFKVIDATGNIIEIPDGSPIPSGCRLHVSALTMDSAQRAAIDEVRERYGAPPIEDDDGEDYDQLDGEDDPDDGGEEMTDEQRDEQRRQDAYYNFRQRIDTANVNRRHRRTAAPVPQAPKPKDPPWLKMKGQGDASLADAEQRRADAYRKFCDKVHTASPRRRGPAPAASWTSESGDAASEQRERLERLKRAYANQQQNR
jgi:hypothetical protein